MIDWPHIDQRLAGIGKDRAWLAEQTPYSADTIRTALAPASIKRSDRMLSVLSRAIEDEEAKHRSVADVGKLLEFEPEEWDQILLHAARAGQEPRAWIRSQILAYLAYLAYLKETVAYPSTVRAALRVAGIDPVEPPIAPFPDAGPASGGGASPGESNGTDA